MLVVQHNCGQGYESTIAALERTISTEAGIVCLKETFIRNRNITHSAFNFYQPCGLRTEARVLTAVKKELVNKIMVENRTNLVNHLYFLVLDIRDLDGKSYRPTRRARVINIYDNRVGQGCTWERETPQNCRAIGDIIQDRVIRG